MSYDIQLVDVSGDPVCVARHSEGGNRVIAEIHCEQGKVYPVRGEMCANLYVTYNYSPHFRQHIDKEQGIRWLYGKTGEECTPKLHAAIRELGTVQDDDYWKATPGNAGFALSILLKWAKQYPNGIFRGD